MTLITPDIQDIFNALKPFESRLVGGAVRDYFLNGAIADDIDIATTALPNDVIKKLTKAGMHVVPTGIKHGTVTAIYKKKPYEITTLRKDLETHGRHATVAFTDEFKEDAKRRDFTFNALYMCENNKISDYFNGQVDLKKGTVRFIGDTETRIQEDYLRILRYFRFQGKFAAEPVFNDETLCIIKKNAPQIQTLSSERITAELLKILKSTHTSLLMKAMQNADICQHIGLPEGDTDNLNKLVNTFPTCCTFTRFACLYQQQGTDSFLTAAKLNFSNKEKSFIKHLFHALKNVDIHKDIYKQLYLTGKDVFIACLMIKHRQEHVLIHRLQAYNVPLFPVKGADLIEEGFQTGPTLGEVLKNLETWWLNNNFPQKSDCIAHLKK
ncbi:MAG: poly(A) polymerase [Alphaproteobacteria bacterium]|jgi:poly(A) polymerase